MQEQIDRLMKHNKLENEESTDKDLEDSKKELEKAKKELEEARKEIKKTKSKKIIYLKSFLELEV